MTKKLFIGIPTWNSERFIGTCLEAIRRTSAGLDPRIVLLDNRSTDQTVQTATRLGCEVHVKPCSLPDALNHLVHLSTSEFSLFLHADTILLSDRWFDLCTSKLTGNVALVSPQDIGCGPYTRPWGQNQPESSFMLFRTAALKRIRQARWVRRLRLPWRQRVVDFYTHNVTHHIPASLKRHRYQWKMMTVHTSRRLSAPAWQPRFEPVCWTDELAHLEYGLGNFYSLDGIVTHYHNWFERLLEDLPDDSDKADIKQGGIPLAYINFYTRRFLTDYANNSVAIPDPHEYPERPPAALPIRGHQTS